MTSMESSSSRASALSAMLTVPRSASISPRTVPNARWGEAYEGLADILYGEE